MLLALMLVMVLVPIRGKSRSHGGKEKKRSNRPTKLASCLTHPCLRLYIPALACALQLYLQSLRSFMPPSPSTGMDSPFVSTHSGSLLPQARALRSLKLQLIQQDCTSLDTPMRLYLYLPSQRDLQFPYPHSDPFGRRWSRPITRPSPSSPAA